MVEGLIILFSIAILGGIVFLIFFNIQEKGKRTARDKSVDSRQSAVGSR